MKILAIDTTGQVASVAILDENQLIGEYTVNYKMQHSQLMMPMLEELCKRTNTTMDEVEYIACSSGPGSFTGLRIGAATAKGLALSLGKKIVPVPTLDALAYSIVGSNNIICPIMDARRNQVYACFYMWTNGKLDPISEMMAESIDEIIDMAEGFDQEVIFLGDGVPVHKERLLKNPDFTLAPLHTRLQRAASLGVYALEMIKEEKSVESHEFELIYLRKSQAEREREERLAKETEENKND
ncbi:tRNA (adenosine(37)-N6)-threonylcarbamoyltransferase complex dimerization subunit type 1 TsaB [Chakrabartyella piscis]|uniref:tRNA (adenosine(37)-N6)-threonylcarbamoyltransferase complex dimerization subunit type 1 TsaB n=1 Tax=Chakrabartyella piscis TaxID=2918914 RepID=UPI0029586BD0|nr:tRNA (adenosine(37)-N6)-threonylcarbamoyltransferase complex dimerization subunit type 1 TsaB [Chakrabartyella piscis]